MPNNTSDSLQTLLYWIYYRIHNEEIISQLYSEKAISKCEQSTQSKNKNKEKHSEKQTAFLFFPSLGVPYYHSCTLDIRIIKPNVYEKHYAIIVEQNLFLEYKHLNFKSLLKISLLLTEQPK